MVCSHSMAPFTGDLHFNFAVKKINTVDNQRQGVHPLLGSHSRSERECNVHPASLWNVFICNDSDAVSIRIHVTIYNHVDDTGNGRKWFISLRLLCENHAMIAYRSCDTAAVFSPAFDDLRNDNDTRHSDNTRTTHASFEATVLISWLFYRAYKYNSTR